MIYPYSDINRLEKPHNYMYTQFQGEHLLQSYQLSRTAVMHRYASASYDAIDSDHILVIFALPVLEKLFNDISVGCGMRFTTFLYSAGRKVFKENNIEDEFLINLAKSLESLTTVKTVTTLDLLHALVAVQITSVPDANTKIWLDRLIQRFEVTKKLYDSYLPGFRKGEGANTSIRLYCLFALALCVFYIRSNEIKYLNTLLKVCDLLCSLPEKLLQGQFPEFGILAILATEIVSVQLLAEQKGVSFETN